MQVFFVVLRQILQDEGISSCIFVISFLLPAVFVTRFVT